MNAWIQVDASYRTHRKTRRLARILGKDARRLPIWLWLYCVESARDGDLSKLSDADLADVLDFTGDAKRLRAALIEAEFLTSAGVVIGWEKRYSAKFKFYQERAKTAAAARWGNRVESPSTPPPSEEKLRIEGEEISKHDQASSKNACSITPRSDWPESHSSEQVKELSLATGKPAELVVAMWPAFRDRKIRYGDDYANGEGLAGFRDFIRQVKVPRAGQTANATPPPAKWLDWLEKNIPDPNHETFSQLLTALNCRNFYLMPNSWQDRCRREVI